MKRTNVKIRNETESKLECEASDIHSSIPSVRQVMEIKFCVDLWCTAAE